MNSTVPVFMKFPQPVSLRSLVRPTEGETPSGQPARRRRYRTSATCFVSDGDALVEDIDCHVSFVLGDNQRWRDPNRARAAAKEQDATVKGQFDDAVAQFGRILPGLLI